MDDKQSIIEWVKAHKKELIAAGISIAVIVGIVLGLKNKEAISDYFKSLKCVIEKQGQRIKVIAEPSNQTIEIKTGTVPEIIEDAGFAILDRDINKKSPHDVSAHLRMLPEGWHASAEKIITARDHGFELPDEGFTWVNKYSTGAVA